MNEHLEEWELVAQARDGDREAFAQLWAINRQPVAHFIASYVRHRAITEDLTSETFLKAWLNLHRVQDQGKRVQAWLFTIARNVCLDHLKRSSTRLTTFVGDLVDLDEMGAGTSPSAESEAARRDAVARLDRLMGRLTIPQQRSLRLKYEQDLCAEDVGNVLGLSVGATKAAQTRGRVSLHRAAVEAGYTSSDDFLGRAA